MRSMQARPASLSSPRWGEQLERTRRASRLAESAAAQPRTNSGRRRTRCLVSARAVYRPQPPSLSATRAGSLPPFSKTFAFQFGSFLASLSPSAASLS
jgi:hypothetical protein